MILRKKAVNEWLHCNVDDTYDAYVFIEIMDEKQNNEYIKEFQATYDKFSPYSREWSGKFGIGVTA